MVIRRTNDDFVFWNSEAAKKYKFKIVLEDIHLKVKLLEVQDSVLRNHFTQYKSKQEMQIKYTRNILKTFTVPAGSFELKQHNLFFGQALPNRVYIAFVEQQAFNDDVTKNPFYFETAGMREGSLTVNSVDEPNPPYLLEKGRTEKALYFSFLENTGCNSFENESVDVSFEEYYNGYFLLSFDRSPLRDNGLSNHIADAGSITVNIKCHKPVTKNYIVLCYASYDEKLIFQGDQVTSQPIFT